MQKIINNRMSEYNKLLASGVAGAFTTVLVWIVMASTEVVIPVTVAQAITVIVSAIFVWLIPNVVSSSER